MVLRVISSDTQVAATSDGDKIFVGAYGDESNSGSVYVYDANNLSATPTKLTAFDGAASDYFGLPIVTNPCCAFTTQRHYSIPV